MLEPVFQENYLGRAEVRNTFRVKGSGTVAGCYVVDGILKREAQIRVVRDGAVIYTSKLNSLKRFKDDASEVRTGFECGAGIANWGSATLTNTIISNNTASETTTYPWFNKGGGIFNQGTLTLTGCTISGNYSQNEGGGIYNTGTLTLSACTLSGNLAVNGSGGMLNASTVTVENFSNISDAYNLGVLYLDSTSTIAILAGNPAILI